MKQNKTRNKRELLSNNRNVDEKHIMQMLIISTCCWWQCWATNENATSTQMRAIASLLMRNFIFSLAQFPCNVQPQYRRKVAFYLSRTHTATETHTHSIQIFIYDFLWCFAIFFSFSSLGRENTHKNVKDHIQGKSTFNKWIKASECARVGVRSFPFALKLHVFSLHRLWVTYLLIYCKHSHKSISGCFRL